MREDPKITEAIQGYLNTPKEERDHDKGAMLLLQVSGNRIQYANIMRKGAATMSDFLEYRLGQYLEFRLAKLTHSQVRQMEVKAAEIVSKSNGEERRVKEGKRDDHDRLPANIQAMYVEVLDCLHKERELHLQIRNLSLRQSPCPDSEVYPFVKEILKLDDRRLFCWRTYDTFKLE